MCMGHGMALFSVVVLLASTGFLMWVASKVDNPFQKFGKVVAWISITISFLMILGAFVMCITMNLGGWSPPCMKWQHKMMQQQNMMQQQMPGMPMMPGMGRGWMPGMRPQMAPGMEPGMGLQMRSAPTVPQRQMQSPQPQGGQ